MENNYSAATLSKAKAAKSPHELRILAKENGVVFTEEQAKAYYERLHGSGELSDEELDAVAGGGCGGSDFVQDGERVVILRHKKMEDGSSHVGHTGVFIGTRTGPQTVTFSVECDCGAKVFVNDKRNDIEKL